MGVHVLINNVEADHPTSDSFQQKGHKIYMILITS